MSEKIQHSFSDYMDNSKQLLKLLFGEELYNKLNSTPIKAIEWDGLDITTCKILATCPNIKERFNEEWIEYFGERDYTLLDLYLQSVFHYGYQQACDYHYDTEKTTKLMEDIQKRLKELDKKDLES